MYICKRCDGSFSTPMIERSARPFEPDFTGSVLLCPLCGSDKLEHIKPRYCKFCGLAVKRGEDYCDAICEKFWGDYQKIHEERCKKVAEFEVSKAVTEVEEYNKKHGTDYSYGKYFALKGLGGLNDD